MLTLLVVGPCVRATFIPKSISPCVLMKHLNLFMELLIEKGVLPLFYSLLVIQLKSPQIIQGTSLKLVAIKSSNILFLTNYI